MDCRDGICETPKYTLGPLLAGVAGFFLGAPSYLFLEGWAGASPAFLDRPWPLWLAQGFLALICIGVAVRAGGGATRRRIALGALGVTIASGAGLGVLARRSLPVASPEIAVGGLLPDLRVTDELGRSISLASLRGHPTVLVFYRGALCVSCRAQLSLLAAHAASFIAEGVRIFGVSSDPPPVSAEWKNTLRLPFSLLSDQHRALAQSLCSASAHCLVLVDPDGRIHWGALNDYWRGSERPEAVLLAAYRLGRR